LGEVWLVDQVPWAMLESGICITVTQFLLKLGFPCGGWEASREEGGHQGSTSFPLKPHGSLKSDI
jgi:hypothetical protein